MSPPVFVIDTNVLIAGLITGSSDSPVARVLDAMLSGSLVYLLSPELLDEYRSVLLRPKLAKLHRLTESEVDRILTELTANAMWREPKTSSPAPDRGDDHLWALLDACPGSILISGDHLLLENPPKKSSVVSPKTWVESFPAGKIGQS